MAILIRRHPRWGGLGPDDDVLWHRSVPATICEVRPGEAIDFVVRFECPADAQQFVSIDCPAGQARCQVQIAVDRLSRLLATGGQVVRGPAPDDRRKSRDLSLSRGAGVSALQIGAELYRALFVDEAARRLFAASRGVAAARGVGLRLLLKFDLFDQAVAQIARLPWELLYDEVSGRFVASGDRRLLLVRSIDVPEFAPELPVRPPLRILAAIANPAGLPPLDLQEERRRISQALAGTEDVEISFLEDTSVATLREWVLASRCQALHFMGHGRFHPATGEGALALTGDDGGPQYVSGPVLARHLGDLGLRLVVLNACRSGEVTDGTVADPFAGVAAALVREGLPAAVAMQFPISDGAANLFSQVFYRRLAQGDTVDGAVSEARLALGAATVGSLEWATPVLYLRVRSGRILELPAHGESPRSALTQPKHGTAIALALLLLGVGLLVSSRFRQIGSPASPPARPAIYGLRVQVVDPEGHPLERSRVRASVGNEPHLLPDGWWELRIPAANVPASGLVVLWAEQDDWQGVQVSMHLGTDPSPRFEIQLREPESWLRGQVVDRLNRPVAEARVSPRGGTPGLAITDVDGHFQLKLAVPRNERVRLRADRAGLPTADGFCYAGRDSCSLVMEEK
jgi:hypothetical protein